MIKFSVLRFYPYLIYCFVWFYLLMNWNKDKNQKTFNIYLKNVKHHLQRNKILKVKTALDNMKHKVFFCNRKKYFFSS